MARACPARRRRGRASTWSPTSSRTDDAAGDLVGPGGDEAISFTTAYGIEPSGAVLVRPDGYVAWRRTRSVPDPTEQLTAALGAVLCRDIDAPTDRAGEPMH